MRHLIVPCVAAGLLATAVQAQDLSLDAQLGLAQVRAPGGGALQTWRTLGLQADSGRWRSDLSLPTCLGSLDSQGASACAFSTAHGSRHLSASREWRLRWDAPGEGPLGSQLSLGGLAWHRPSRLGQLGEHGSQIEWSLSAPLGAWEAWLGEALPLARNEASAWRSRFLGLAWHAHALSLQAEWDDAHHVDRDDRDRQLSLSLAWRDGANQRWQLKGLRAWDDPQQPWQWQAAIDWRW